MNAAQYALLVFLGIIAGAINAVAGGGTLVSFPGLIAMGIAERVANATNSVGLWPGSLASGFGFLNLLGKTQHALKTLFLPTLLGALCGAVLLLNTSNAVFRDVAPALILIASLLLFFQPKIKEWVGHSRKLPLWAGILLQFLVATYGGYFGAGMGIMMLACFALYIDGTVHELNAVKNFLAVIINIAASGLFFLQKGLVLPMPALALVIGGIIGGFSAARLSQRLDPNKLRPAIAVYGFLMAGYFAWRAIA